MPNPSTQSTEFWSTKYDLARDSFRSGEDSADLFRAKLYRLGFRGQEIEAEVRLYRPVGAATMHPRRTEA